MRRRSRHARFGALGPRSRTLLVIGVTVVVLLTMPWLSLRYGGPNWVALSQSSSTIAQEPPFEDGTHLEATLLGVNEAPRADTAAYGTARFTINEDETRLAYRINVNNIDDITAVHIQLGDVGANGPIALTLFDGASAFDSDGAIAGTRDVSVTQANNILAGDYYVNVLTADFPNGEIRGQIRPDDPVARRFDAHLDGDNEVPPVDTTADGDAQLFLSDDQTRLTYRISLEDIESVTTIDIHRGQPGANGPVVHELVDEPDSFDPVSPITGTLTLTQDDRDDLSGGNYWDGSPSL
ncbi:MAG: hypothetical protein MAG451_01288 [Anaerolineales bacterium]|nr:hypothetical protein [Anaerolineales bacterium]